MNLTDRTSGVALIAGSIGVLATISLHPLGQGLFDPATYESVTRHLMVVHSIALLSLPLWFLGAIGLSRRLDSGGHAAIVPLTFYGFALAAMLSCVTFDGLVMPGLAREIVNAAPGAGQAWRVAFNANEIVAMAFLHVFQVASSLALILWSVMMVRKGTLSRGLGYLGMLVGAATLLALLAGHLDRSHHAFALSILLQNAWLIAVGVALLRTQAQPARI
jgi:hypothetical protein